jgi:hypothetical protein
LIFLAFFFFIVLFFPVLAANRNGNPGGVVIPSEQAGLALLRPVGHCGTLALV